MNGTNCQMINDCVNVSSVNMFKNRIDIYLIRVGYTDEKIVGLSISQWLPCPLCHLELVWDLVKSSSAIFLE